MKTNQEKLLDEINVKLSEVTPRLTTFDVKKLEEIVSCIAQIEETKHFDFTKMKGVPIGKQFYLEVSGRQTGKTTRMVKKIVQLMTQGKRVCIVAPNQNGSNMIKRDQQVCASALHIGGMGCYKAPIYTSISRLIDSTRGYNIDTFFFDEFDSIVPFDLLHVTDYLNINPFDHYWATTSRKVYSMIELQRRSTKNWKDVRMLEYFLIIQMLSNAFPIITYRNNSVDSDWLSLSERGFHLVYKKDGE